MFFLKEAEKKGVLLKSPMGGVELPEHDSEARDPFTESELGLLIDYLKAETDSEENALPRDEKKLRRNWLTVVTIGLCTGARLGDCANMRWSNVDFQGKRLRFVPEKGRKNKELPVPMHSDLESYLMNLEAPDRRSDAYLAPMVGGASAGRRGGALQGLRVYPGRGGNRPTSRQEKAGRWPGLLQAGVPQSTPYL